MDIWYCKMCLGMDKQKSVKREKLLFHKQELLCSSVATKIENGPKMNTKILWILKMDQRLIQRIFVDSKILRRSLKIANSSNIFEDTKIFKENEIFVVKNFLPGSKLNKFSQQ